MPGGFLLQKPPRCVDLLSTKVHTVTRREEQFSSQMVFELSCNHTRVLQVEWLCDNPEERLRRRLCDKTEPAEL